MMVEATEQAKLPTATPPHSRRFLPALFLLFVGSGCAALIYEIVWFQLLQLVIGASAISLGLLLGSFMGGMCLGSLALARFVPARWHPLRVYAVLELGIAICGVMVLLAVPAAGRVYALHGAHGLAGIVLRGTISSLFLLPPTLLMGATLPAMARWIEATPRGVSWLGGFYGGNIAGAVCGCLLAGFYLLRLHDLATATYVAIGINLAVALAGLALAAMTSHRPPAPSENALIPGRGPWPVYLSIALSGFCALGSEVVWTRLLSVMLGASVYTFSIILAVFLLGLGLGSSLGAALARGTVRPRLALAVCQLLLVAAMAWAALIIAKSLPYWPVNPSLSRSPWFNFQLDLVRCAWAILPATCLWGASFPLALAGVTSAGQDSGRLVGRVYAANTVGAIVGAIACSLLLLGWVGTHQTQRLLMGISAGGALVMFASMLRKPPLAGGPGANVLKVGLSSCAASALATWLIWSAPAVPWQMMAYGRYLATKEDCGRLLYLGEGLNSSVAVTELGSGVRNFHVSGKVEASTDGPDMRLQRMLGHLPALFHAKPQSILVVGCGAGVTAGSFVTYPAVEKIVICDIEPLIPRQVTPFFQQQNYNVVKDPRTTVIYDDARHYVLSTPEKFDIITSDPIHPWVKGVAALYTKEYYQMVKEHLNPGGVVAQWVPLYETDRAVVKSELATFFDVFPEGTIWSNDQDGEGYDILLLAQAGDLKINLDDLQARLQREGRAAESLKEVGFRSIFGLLATYSGRGEDFRPWLQDAEINRDRNLRLQYLAGLGLDLNQSAAIYDEIRKYRKFPEDLFLGAELRRRMLKVLLDHQDKKATNSVAPAKGPD